MSFDFGAILLVTVNNYHGYLVGGIGETFNRRVGRVIEGVRPLAPAWTCTGQTTSFAQKIVAAPPW